MEIETLSLERGYLAKPKAAGPHPAVIVVHEWWGLVPHIKDICGRFAREGFVSLAPDLYGGRIAQDAAEASKMMDALKTEEGMRRIEEALHYLAKQPFVASGRVGITGFCMGGSFALLAACRLKGIRASSPFYGHYPAKPEEMAKISCPVLFFAGGRDEWINAKVTGTIEEAFKKHKKEGRVVVYPDADHAFFNDTRPEVYQREAAFDAWKKTLAFFRETLRT
jgi:carboxymethylenebutenolidase